MTLALVDEALQKGVRLEAVCERLGVAPRTVQRWKKPQTAEDRRCGPRTQPANRLSELERRRILALANSEEFRDASPKQIVPGWRTGASTWSARRASTGCCAKRGSWPTAGAPRRPRPGPGPSVRGRPIGSLAGHLFGSLSRSDREPACSGASRIGYAET